MYLWSALLAGASLAITYVESRALTLVVVGGVGVILLGTAVPRVFSRNGRPRARVAPVSPPGAGPGAEGARSAEAASGTDGI